MYHLTEVDFTFVVESFLDDVTQFYATHEKFKCNVGLEASTCIILRKSFVDFTFVVESFLDDFITPVFGHVTSSND